MAGISGTGGVNNSRLDIASRYGNVNGEDYDAYVNRWEEEEKLKQLYEDKTTLDFQDMLNLMIAQFQNQTMDDQADTSDMMNQLVQMSTMQAMNEMVDHMEELRLANVMSYAASLVEKEVTVGVWKDVDVLNDDGTITKMRQLEEICEKVVGMGTYGGQQVIFLEKSGMFYLSDILAVGKLPPKEDEGDGGDDGDEVDGIDPDFGVGDGNDDENAENKEVENTESTENNTGNPDYNGENGAETEGVG